MYRLKKIKNNYLEEKKLFYIPRINDSCISCKHLSSELHLVPIIAKRFLKNVREKHFFEELAKRMPKYLIFRNHRKYALETGLRTASQSIGRQVESSARFEK